MPRGTQEKKLTPALVDAIVARVLAGAFPHVAAQAEGVSEKQFSRWIVSAGYRHAQNAPHRALFARLLQAKAIARCDAEARVFQSDPFKWLQAGPGKEARSAAGWSFLKHEKPMDDSPISDLLLHPGFAPVMATIREQLSDKPEALEAISQALDDSKAKDAKPIDNTPSENGQS